MMKNMSQPGLYVCLRFGQYELRAMQYISKGKVAVKHIKIILSIQCLVQRCSLRGSCLEIELRNHSKGKSRQ